LFHIFCSIYFVPYILFHIYCSIYFVPYCSIYFVPYCSIYFVSFLSEPMGEQLPDSVRVIICKMYDDNKRCVDIARKLGIRYGTVVSVIALYRMTERVVSLKRGAPKRVILNEEVTGFVRRMFYDGESLRRMQARVLAGYGIRVSVTTLQRATKCFFRDEGRVEPAVVESAIESVVVESAIESAIESVVVESAIESAIESVVVKSVVVKSVVVKSVVIKSVVIKSDVIKSDVIKSDVIKSDVIKSDVISEYGNLDSDEVRLTPWGDWWKRQG